MDDFAYGSAFTLRPLKQQKPVSSGQSSCDDFDGLRKSFR